MDSCSAHKTFIKLIVGHEASPQSCSPMSMSAKIKIIPNETLSSQSAMRKNSSDQYTFARRIERRWIDSLGTNSATSWAIDCEGVTDKQEQSNGYFHPKGTETQTMLPQEGIANRESGRRLVGLVIADNSVIYEALTEHVMVISYSLRRGWWNQSSHGMCLVTLLCAIYHE